jgi:hypothetical protein
LTPSMGVPETVVAPGVAAVLQLPGEVGSKVWPSIPKFGRGGVIGCDGGMSSITGGGDGLLIAGGEYCLGERVGDEEDGA